LGLRGLLSIISLLNVVVLARALGPAGRGEYFLFVAGVAVVTRLADVGMSPAAVVFVGRDPASFQRIHRQLGRALVAISFAAVLVGVVLAAIGVDVHLAPLLVALVLPLTLYEQVWVHLMVGLRRILIMNLVQAGGGLLTLALNVVLVLVLAGDVETAIGIFIVVASVKMVVMLATSRHLARRPSSSTSANGATPPVHLKDLISFGIRGYPNSVAGLLWTRLPAFVLGALHGPAAVGIFSVAQQVQEQLLLPVQAMQDAIYQTVTSSPRPAATAAMNRYLRVGLWSMLPVFAVGAVLAPFVVPLLFGPDFGEAARVLQILLISAAVSVLTALLSPYFFGQLGRPGLISALAWGRVVAAFGLAFVLGGPLAEIGVAIGLSLSDVALALVTVSLYVRLAHTSARQFLVPSRADFELLGSAVRYGSSMLRPFASSPGSGSGSKRESE
jgi:O-antigen/teichoic acid export membrane protein